MSLRIMYMASLTYNSVASRRTNQTYVYFTKKKEREKKNVYFDDISNVRRETQFLCIQKQSIAGLTILTYIDIDYYRKNQCFIIR